MKEGDATPLSHGRLHRRAEATPLHRNRLDRPLQPLVFHRDEEGGDAPRPPGHAAGGADASTVRVPPHPASIDARHSPRSLITMPLLEASPLPGLDAWPAARHQLVAPHLIRDAASGFSEGASGKLPPGGSTSAPPAPPSFSSSSSSFLLSQPIFLQGVARYLDEELGSHPTTLHSKPPVGKGAMPSSPPMPVDTEHRIRVGRQAFQMVIGEFATYRPIFLTIKAAYDDRIHFLETQVERFLADEHLLQQERERCLVAQDQAATAIATERAAMDKLRQKYLALQHEAASKEREYAQAKTELQLQLDSANASIIAERALRREAEDSSDTFARMHQKLKESWDAAGEEVTQFRREAEVTMARLVAEKQTAEGHLHHATIKANEERRGLLAYVASLEAKVTALTPSEGHQTAADKRIHDLTEQLKTMHRQATWMKTELDRRAPFEEPVRWNEIAPELHGMRRSATTTSHDIAVSLYKKYQRIRRSEAALRCDIQALSYVRELLTGRERLSLHLLRLSRAQGGFVTTTQQRGIAPLQSSSVAMLLGATVPVIPTTAAGEGEGRSGGLVIAAVPAGSAKPPPNHLRRGEDEETMTAGGLLRAAAMPVALRKDTHPWAPESWLVVSAGDTVMPSAKPTMSPYNGGADSGFDLHYCTRLLMDAELMGIPSLTNLMCCAVVCHTLSGSQPPQSFATSIERAVCANPVHRHALATHRAKTYFAALMFALSSQPGQDDDVLTFGWSLLRDERDATSHCEGILLQARAIVVHCERSDRLLNSGGKPTAALKGRLPLPALLEALSLAIPGKSTDDVAALKVALADDYYCGLSTPSGSTVAPAVSNAARTSGDDAPLGGEPTMLVPAASQATFPPEAAAKDTTARPQAPPSSTMAAYYGPLVALGVNAPTASPAVAALLNANGPNAPPAAVGSVLVELVRQWARDVTLAERRLATAIVNYSLAAAAGSSGKGGSTASGGAIPLSVLHQAICAAMEIPLGEFCLRWLCRAAISGGATMPPTAAAAGAGGTTQAQQLQLLASAWESHVFYSYGPGVVQLSAMNAMPDASPHHPISPSNRLAASPSESFLKPAGNRPAPLSAGVLDASVRPLQNSPGGGIKSPLDASAGGGGGPNCLFPSPHQRLPSVAEAANVLLRSLRDGLTKLSQRGGGGDRRGATTIVAGSQSGPRGSWWQATIAGCPPATTRLLFEGPPSTAVPPLAATASVSPAGPTASPTSPPGSPTRSSSSPLGSSMITAASADPTEWWQEPGVAGIDFDDAMKALRCGPAPIHGVVLWQLALAGSTPYCWGLGIGITDAVRGKSSRNLLRASSSVRLVSAT